MGTFGRAPTWSIARAVRISTFFIRKKWTLNEQAVRVQGDVLQVNLTLSDPFVATYLKGFPPEEQPQIVLQAIQTGIHAIAAAKTNGGVLDLSDKLQSSVNAAGQHAASITQAVSEKLESVTEAYLGENGKFSKTIDDFEKAIAAKFGPDSKEMREFRAQTRADFDRHSKAVVDDIRSLMNIADEKSPIAKVHRDVQAIGVQLAAFKVQVEQQANVLQARRSTAPVAGRSLEEFFHGVVAPIAAIHADTFDDVRNVPSTTAERAKVGDFVMTLDGSAARGSVPSVVAELKNRKTGTTTALLRELDAAMYARQAMVAIGVLTNPDIKGRPITAYGRNKVIVALPGFGAPDCNYEYFASLIELGYEYARLLAVAAATTGAEDELDLGAITAGLDEFSEVGKGFKEILDNITRVVTAAETTRETTTAMRDKFQAAGKKMRALIQAEIKRVTTKKALSPGAEAA